MDAGQLRSRQYQFLNGHNFDNNNSSLNYNHPSYVGCNFHCWSIEFIIHSFKISNTVDYTLETTPQIYNPYGFRCGDGTRHTQALEECDDGNNDGDNSVNIYNFQCDENCFIKYDSSWSKDDHGSLIDAVCGDGLYSPQEECDDGNKDDGDGCDQNCAIESGYQCYGMDNQTCEIYCGDGIKTGSEQCDDGNLIAGDGCAANCTFETDLTCTGQGASIQCSRICGNGILLASDNLTTYCDDGDQADGDGCDSNCAVETGYNCTSINLGTSVCEPICGDGIQISPEQCDDGNLIVDDGCAADCTIETDFNCTVQGTISQCSRNCGNGILRASDELSTYCDDGNLDDGDGCNSNCSVETGYTCTSISLATSICGPICGDGLKLELEACDDSNVADGDGCSSNCTIEDKSMCVDQTPTGPSVCRVCVIEHCKECDPSDYDKCQTCEDLYELKNPTTCYSYSIFEVSESAQQMSSGSQAVSGVSAGATVGVSLLNLSSLAAIWSIVNQLQLFLLLLLTKTPFPGDVKALILGNELMQFNLDLLPVRALPKMPEVMDWLKIDQDNSYLETIGVESSTSLLNNFGFALCMLLMLALYPLVMTLKLCVNYENENKCSVNYLMILIIDLFNFTIYIRLVLGGFQLLLICCISEVIKFDLETIPNIISMMFSVLILTVCVGTIALSFYIFYSKRDFHDPDKYYKLNEFITGLKNTRYARIYPFLGLMRRTMFVIWLLTFTWLECVYLTAGMMVVQIFFVLSLVTLRPFDRPENNLIEIVNEIIYTTLLSIMIICDKVDEWSSTVTNIFCYIILANSLVITFIMIGALLVSLCQKCAKKKSGTTTSRVQPIQEVSQQRMGNTYNTHRVNSDLSSIKIITTDDSHNIAKLFEEARKKSKNSKMQTKRQEIKF
ncbi:unnamed protein product [Moneuplotes crassus]|uniref:DUF4215 domain-containing protein n=1 Tax=Euplotes crassus TaxID=5936 RepID=A0AAD1XYB9_EUPCR|nr:unnamed protein product [Moneuplotes crassus]